MPLINWTFLCFSVWISIYFYISCGLLLSGYSMPIYYVACFHFAHKSLSSVMCSFPLFNGYCKGDNHKSLTIWSFGVKYTICQLVT